MADEKPDLPDPSPFHVSTEHYIYIGKITAAWSLLESYLYRAIWGLLAVDPDVGRSLTKHMLSFRLILNAFRSLADVQMNLGLDEKANLKSLLGDLEKAASKRNAVIHAEWWGVEGYDTSFAHYKTSIDDYDSTKFLEIHLEILTCLQALINFLKSNDFPLPVPLPDK